MNYRLDKETIIYNIMCGQLEEAMRQTPYFKNMCFPCVLASLGGCYYVTGSFPFVIRDIHDISKFSVFKGIHRVASTIFEHMLDDEIEFPIAHHAL